MSKLETIQKDLVLKVEANTKMIAELKLIIEKLSASKAENEKTISNLNETIKKLQSQITALSVPLTEQLNQLESLEIKIGTNRLRMDNSGLLLESGVSKMYLKRDLNVEINVGKELLLESSLGLKIITGIADFQIRQLLLKSSESMNIDSGTELKLRSATNTNIHSAMKLTMVSHTEASLRSPTVSLKSDAGMTLDGGATTTIKGGMVNIN